ncbi:MAG: hypothetical protein KL863_11605 [Rhizobium sp.]|nr:hypothetical protein [Rhizobium sp.]
MAHPTDSHSTDPAASDQSQGAGRRDEPVRGNPHDMQIDENTGLPFSIVPDGEKPEPQDEVAPEDRLRIDPESRIPRPVQPDLA